MEAGPAAHSAPRPSWGSNQEFVKREKEKRPLSSATRIHTPAGLSKTSRVAPTVSSPQTDASAPEAADQPAALDILTSDASSEENHLDKILTKADSM